jgi:hypothetical protein
MPALVGAGVPLALGWSASVADDMATEFTESFYRRLIRGEPVAVAAAHARNAIRRRGTSARGGWNLQDATFALPQVYTSVSGGELYDRTAPPIAYAGPRTEYTLLGDGIKGLRQGYVGRRREGQRLVPALRDGDVTLAVITGLGGAGKSTLATRAANRLDAAGVRVVPVRAVAGDHPADGARQTLSKLIDALDRSFLAEGRDDLHGLLTDGKIPLAQRLRLAVEGLNELRLALVLDNFEDVLELETRRIADPELAGFYVHLATHLTRGSCVLVTCRYLPADTPDRPSSPRSCTCRCRTSNRTTSSSSCGATRWWTAAFIGASCRGPARPALPQAGRDPGLPRGVRRGPPHDRSRRAAGGAGGRDVRAVSAASEQYYQRIFAARLFAALPPAARDLNARLALSELPLPLDAVTQITGLGPRRGSAKPETRAWPSARAAVPRPLTCRPCTIRPACLRPLADGLRTPRRGRCARRVHGQLATFWRSSYEADRETELRVPDRRSNWPCGLDTRRQAGDGPTFRWATVRLAGG